jgi:tetratricopeptide (TPR) repeat protein
MTEKNYKKSGARRKRGPLAAVIGTLLALGMPHAAFAQAAAPDTYADKPAAEIDAHSSPESLASELDAYPDARSLVAQRKFADALHALQARASAHENDPRYSYLLGAVALKVPDYAAAASAFERVVVMQPENAGAWMDLAIASAELGNTVSALEYFKYVETEFNPPPALRDIIATYRRRLTAQAAPASPWRGHAQTAIGIDTNANSGLNVASIPLTVRDERIDLTLDPAYRARSDTYAQVAADATWKHPVDGNTLELSAGVRQRSFRHEHDFSTTELDASAGLQRPTALGDAGAWVYVEHLSLGGKALVRNMRAVVQIERPHGECRSGLAADFEWRRYISLSALDANITWLQAGIACDLRVIDHTVQTALIGRIGYDRSMDNRPGGDTRRAELAARVSGPLAYGVTVELSATLSFSRDTLGYSPLLEQNAVRRLDRGNARILLTKPLGRYTDAMLLIEDNRYHSNLDLFEQSGKNYAVGIRQRF